MKFGEGQTISSTANPAIKSVIRLRKKSERAASGLILVEGAREISRALRGGIAVKELFLCPTIPPGEEGTALIDRLLRANTKITTVSKSVFAKIAYREGVGGIVAVAARPPTGLRFLPAGEDPLILAVDRVEKPGNLGAIFRSADGSGATGIIISDPAAEPGNPNVIRASLGTVFTVPCAVTGRREAIEWLRERGIAIIVTTPDGDKLYSDIDMKPPSAIVVGSEEAGVAPEWLEAADFKARIPMLGSADSLNVSAAAALILYEALRQRSR